ncbi:MAG: fructose-6-phosphate aldolase [Flavobacteriales bacterium]|nr:fructose-6-phosphate aldolase [Flavobacteriales bacterium]
MHILKIKGTGKIPDFVQIRDKNLSLKAYFRADQIERGFKKNDIEDPSGKLKEIIINIPFGKIFKYKEDE